MIFPEVFLKLAPYLAAIGLAFGGYFYVHHSGFVEGQHAIQAKWDKATAEQTQAHMQATLANQKIITNLEVTRNENIAYIAKLNADNTALDKRLHLPHTACPRILPPVAATGGSQDSSAASGVVQPDVSTSAEEAVNEFDATYRAESLRCDKLIEDVRPVLKWANTLNL